MFLIRQIFLLFKMLKNPDVKIWDKLKILLMLLYIISPVDLIPAPVFGFSIIDDLIILVFLINVINKLMIKYNYKNTNRNINKEDIIEDVEYEVNEEDKGDE